MIAGVVGAPSSVTSIQVANLLKLFKIPQVRLFLYQITTIRVLWVMTLERKKFPISYFPILDQIIPSMTKQI